MSETKRTRNFVAIGYPESLDPEWISKLEETHIPIVISPLHDKDTNPNGETKKEHYHIMLLYDAPHTYEQAQNVFTMIGATKCEIVNSTRGQARYLCHLDNQEKYQYPTNEVKCLNGVDYLTLIELPTDELQSVREMIAYIKENNVRAFSDIVEYAAEHNENWYRALVQKNTLFIKEYIKSRTWKLDREFLTGTGSSNGVQYNVDTGEIVEPGKIENE